ncbi:MAG: hypothetical protein EOO27_05210 [Comamonadaceae bacterium]|nr:MAG: hypothetical protein EOO27_05210 [Comamonadaceae bacterium]
MSFEPLATREIEQVLSCALTYDEVDAESQRRVREVWDQRTTQRRERLDLAVEFRAQGRSWSECGADGHVVRCR